MTNGTIGALLGLFVSLVFVCQAIQAVRSGQVEIRLRKRQEQHLYQRRTDPVGFWLAVCGLVLSALLFGTLAAKLAIG